MKKWSQLSVNIRTKSCIVLRVYGNICLCDSDLSFDSFFELRHLYTTHTEFNSSIQVAFDCF